MRYDRSAIMRRANQLHGELKMSRREALSAAWEEARETKQAHALAIAPMPAAARPAGQEPGLRGAMRRYGVDRLAERAQRFVSELVATAAQSALALGDARAHVLRIGHADRAAVLDYARGPDGVWQERGH